MLWVYVVLTWTLLVTAPLPYVPIAGVMVRAPFEKAVIRFVYTALPEAYQVEPS